MPAYRITTHFILLPPRSLYSLLHPLLHFAFVPPSLKIAFTDQFIKLFVGHAGETGDVVHVEQGIIGTQQYAVVACCGQHGHNVLCEIYEGCANAGNLLSCAFRAGLLRIPRITGEVTGFRITHTTMIAGEITERPYQLFKYVFTVR